MSSFKNYSNLAFLFIFINCSYLQSIFSLEVNLSDAEIPANYTIKWFDQRIDNFNYVRQDTFKQRYVQSVDHWCDGCPIFLFLGGEDDIMVFATRIGFLWENAEQFNAMVVFVEHRYYGESSPFSNVQGNLTKLGYLTVEQALADFAQFIYYIKETTPGANNSPVFIFGGSYSAMLAVWFRIKYAHLTIGALASSAPILDFTYHENIECGNEYNAYYEGENITALEDYLWKYQTCTELPQHWCNVPSPIDNSTFNWTSYSDDCFQVYGIRPEKTKSLVEFGGANLYGATNIILYNGNKDPWYQGGILKSLSPTLIPIIVNSSSHMDDIRVTPLFDTQELRDGRKQEIAIIKQWISNYYNNNSGNFE